MSFIHLIFIGLATLACSRNEDCDRFYFLKCPRDVVVLEGSNVTLPCVGRFDSDTCAWQYLNGKFTSQTLNLKYSTERHKLAKESNTDCSMIIDEVSDEDNTLWQCCPFFTGAAHPACTPHLTLTVAKSITTVLIYTSDNIKEIPGSESVTVTEDTPTELVCEAKNVRPRPTATWYYISSYNDTLIPLNSSLPMMIKQGRMIDNVTDPLVSRIQILRDYISVLIVSWNYTDHNHMIECLVEYPGVSEIKRSGNAKLNVLFEAKLQRSWYRVKNDRFTVKLFSNPPPSHTDIRVNAKATIENVTCQESECEIKVRLSDSENACKDNITLYIQDRAYEIECETEDDNNTALVLGVSLGVFVLVVLLLLAYVIYQRKKENRILRKIRAVSTQEEIQSKEEVTALSGDSEKTVEAEMETSNSENEITYTELTFEERESKNEKPKDSPTEYAEIKKN